MQELLLAQEQTPRTALASNDEASGAMNADDAVPVHEDPLFSREATPSTSRPPVSTMSTINRPPRPVQPNTCPDPKLTESSDSRRDGTIHTESSAASDEQRVVTRNDMFDL